MRKFFEKSLKNSGEIFEQEIFRNRVENLFIEKSLRYTRSSPIRICEKDLLPVFGEELDFDALKFSRVFKIDSAIKRDEMRKKVDERVTHFLKIMRNMDESEFRSFKNQCSDERSIFYKSFFLKLSQMEPQLNPALKNLMERKDIKGSIRLFENMMVQMEKSYFPELGKEKKEKEEVKDSTLEMFLLDLNSGKTDYLLDRLAILDERLSKESDTSTESELFLLKNLFKFIRGRGVMPMKKIGKRFSGNLYSVMDGEYEGTPFQGDEVKELVVERAGWRFMSRVISAPLYREVISETDI